MRSNDPRYARRRQSRPQRGFRIATKLWLNRVRDRRELPIEAPEPAGVPPHDALSTREAAALQPQ